jgi:hypothetical protein
MRKLWSRRNGEGYWGAVRCLKTPAGPKTLAGRHEDLLKPGTQVTVTRSSRQAVIGGSGRCSELPTASARW